MKKAGVILLLLALILFSNLVSAGELKVTSEHPFLIEGNWVSANQLNVGDKLTLADGRKAVIKNIKRVVPADAFKVYNLETEKYNDFVVGVEGLVVHNSNLEGGFGPCDFCSHGPCPWNTGACGGLPNPRLNPANQKNVITWSVKNDPPLLKYAHEVEKQGFSEKMQSLMETKFAGGRLPQEHDVPGTCGPIWEGGQHAAGGPRLYFKIIRVSKLDDEGKLVLGEIQIVAISSKHNQQQVINRLRKLYPR